MPTEAVSGNVLFGNVRQFREASSRLDFHPQRANLGGRNNLKPPKGSGTFTAAFPLIWVADPIGLPKGN
jgi:hypothetical protein